MVVATVLLYFGLALAGAAARRAAYRECLFVTYRRRQRLRLAGRLIAAGLALGFFLLCA